MGSVFRYASGRCSCREEQPDHLRRAICDELLARLETLRKQLTDPNFEMALYAEEVQSMQGQDVTFETICEVLSDQQAVVVVRAFVHTWRRPTWVDCRLRVGHMFADGLLWERSGQVAEAPDELMMDFR